MVADASVEGGQVRAHRVVTAVDCEVEVHTVPSDDDPRGVGETGVPPIAPTVANAIFDATGIRVRQMPIRREDLGA